MQCNLAFASAGERRTDRRSRIDKSKSTQPYIAHTCPAISLSNIPVRGMSEVWVTFARSDFETTAQFLRLSPKDAFTDTAFPCAGEADSSAAEDILFRSATFRDESSTLARAWCALARPLRGAQVRSMACAGACGASDRSTLGSWRLGRLVCMPGPNHP